MHVKSTVEKQNKQKRHYKLNTYKYMRVKSTVEKLSREFSMKTFFITAFVLGTVQYLFNYSVYSTTKSWNISKYWKGFPSWYTPYCPVIPPDLQGRVTVDTQIPAWITIEEDNPLLEPGGRYKPTECEARHRVAIIVPYRDRTVHLRLFIQNMHPFLQRQQLDYGIFVVEMAIGVKFNRALLFNVGFVEAMKQYDYQCFILHDVDLLPQDDRNLYTCPTMPRHMSRAIDKARYHLHYETIFGGVSAIRTDHFRLINGYSNSFFGWGGEDDDAYKRLMNRNLTVVRYPDEVARYKMLGHRHDVKTENPQRFQMLGKSTEKQDQDGLSTLEYKLIKLEQKPLYTWILVTVNMTNVLKKASSTNNQRKQPAKLDGLGPSKLGQSVPPEKQKLTVSSYTLETVVDVATGIAYRTGVSRKKEIIDRTQPDKDKRPKTISWIPEDFEGELPDHLAIYEGFHFGAEALNNQRNVTSSTEASQTTIKPIVTVDKSTEQDITGILIICAVLMVCFLGVFIFNIYVVMQTYGVKRESAHPSRKMDPSILHV